jgi:hypothetical protein
MPRPDLPPTETSNATHLQAPRITWPRSVVFQHFMERYEAGITSIIGVCVVLLSVPTADLGFHNLVEALDAWGSRF